MRAIAALLLGTVVAIVACSSAASALSRSDVDEFSPNLWSDDGTGFGIIQPIMCQAIYPAPPSCYPGYRFVEPFLPA